MRDPVTQGHIDLAAAFRWASGLGIHEAVANHFSLAVAEDGSRFLKPPRGRHFSRVHTSELLIDADGSVLGGKGFIDPTTFHIHSAIHHGVPHACCILHTHMPHATALTCIEGGRLEPVSQNALRFSDRVANDEEVSGITLDNDEGARLCAALGDKPVLFIGNHGLCVASTSVAEAFDELYFLENACETQVLAMSTGRPRDAMPLVNTIGRSSVATVVISLGNTLATRIGITKRKALRLGCASDACTVDTRVRTRGSGLLKNISPFIESQLGAFILITNIILSISISIKIIFLLPARTQLAPPNRSRQRQHSSIRRA